MNQIAADNNFNVPAVIGAARRSPSSSRPAVPGRLPRRRMGRAGRRVRHDGQRQGSDGPHGTMGAGRLQEPARPRTHRGPALRTRVVPVPGGRGRRRSGLDAFGGGDGFAKDASPEAVDFLGFITNTENQRTWGTNSGLPVNGSANDAVADPNMQAVLEGLNDAGFMQLYLDQFFTAEVGGAVNDATQTLFAGTASPEDAATAITWPAAGGRSRAPVG